MNLSWPVRCLVALFFAILSVGLAVAPALAAEPEPVQDGVWYSVEEGEVLVHLYFYWSPTCPHCLAARPFVEALPATYPWIVLHSHDIGELSGSESEFAQALQVEVGESIRGVPAIFFCESLQTGFGAAETTGAYLEAELVSCHDELIAGLTPEVSADEQIDLPIVGDIDPTSVSLPVFTVAIAALDAFNPCAFFVLLFLLSLLVHAKSRSRMAMIGGIFVLFSGLIYFALMAAWLNVFIWLGPLRIITALAGLVAITLAAINIKDYFVAGGPSLSIPNSAKPGLFKRMRGLTSASGFGAVAVGAATLAVAANSYELLCTTGFPLAFTRVLTLKDLPTGTYYGYLLLYNVVYVLPLLAIVGLFVWKLGSRKLTEREGRTLKLLSGTMMAGLGTVMLVSPDLLTNVATAIGLLATALVVTFLISRSDRRATRRGSHARFIESRS